MQCIAAVYCYRHHMPHGLCVCLCVGHTDKLCENGQTVRDAVWRLTYVDPENYVLDGMDQMNSFSARRGDNTLMWSFATLL